ncbi:MAG: hypothetical protein K2P57_07440 [Burkholderiales bacterium]|nr:hypothetical protein [Burkholderiales bacterium]
MLHQLRWKAIVMGLIAGIIAGAIWSVVEVIVLPHDSYHLDPSNPLVATPTYIILSLIGAFGSSLVAGWVSAHLAKRAEVANSLAVGGITVLLSAVLFFPLAMNKLPLSYNIPAFALTVPFSILGGLIRRKARVRVDP